MATFETVFSKEKLFEIIQKNPGHHISEYTRLLGCLANQTTKRFLDVLIAEGKIKKIQTKQGTNSLFTYEVV